MDQSSTGYHAPPRSRTPVYYPLPPTQPSLITSQAPSTPSWQTPTAFFPPPPIRAAATTASVQQHYTPPAGQPHQIPSPNQFYPQQSSYLLDARPAIVSHQYSPVPQYSPMPQYSPTLPQPAPYQQYSQYPQYSPQPSPLQGYNPAQYLQPGILPHTQAPRDHYAVGVGVQQSMNTHFAPGAFQAGPVTAHDAPTRLNLPPGQTTTGYNSNPSASLTNAGANLHTPRTSLRQGSSALLAGLSHLVQSKAQGYLNKRATAQTDFDAPVSPAPPTAIHNPPEATPQTGAIVVNTSSSISSVPVPNVEVYNAQSIAPPTTEIRADPVPISANANPPVLEGKTPYSLTFTSITQPMPVTSSMSNTTGSIAQPVYQAPPTSNHTTSMVKKTPGLISNLASQFGQMLVSDSPGTSSSQAQHDSWEYDDPMGLVSPVRATGAPSSVSRVCFEREVDYEATWYHLKATPNFLICTWCFQNYIKDTELATSFESIRKRLGKCRFPIPRLTKSLWPTACCTGDLSATSEFMARRVDITDCKGVGGAVMADKIKWYVDLEREIPGFIACEACYEDIILGSGFASHFKEHPSTQGPNDKWSCDASLGYNKRAIKRLSKNKDIDGGWADFVLKVTKRMEMPECNGNEILASKRKWYRPRSIATGIDFCETCFMDELALTPYAKEFVEVADRDALSKAGLKLCDLKLLSMRECAYVNLLKRSDFNVFLTAAKEIAASPRCQGDKGIVGGKWYNFTAEVSNFGICEGCYTGIFAPNGLSQFLSSKPRSAGADVELLCVFHSRQPRFNEFIFRWSEMIETGVWATYEDYVRKWAPILSCAREAEVSARAWYGWPECAVCQACYELFVAGTALAESMPLQNTYIEEQKVCSMYSPRMREKYTTACAAGKTDELLALSQERWVVHQACIPKIKMLKQKAEGETIMANAQMQMYANHSSISVLDSAIGSWEYSSARYNGTTYGNSWDAVAAQCWDKAQAGYARARDPALWAEISRLEGLWKAVE